MEGKRPQIHFGRILKIAGIWKALIIMIDPQARLFLLQMLTKHRCSPPGGLWSSTGLSKILLHRQFDLFLPLRSWDSSCWQTDSKRLDSAYWFPSPWLTLQWRLNESRNGHKQAQTSGEGREGWAGTHACCLYPWVPDRWPLTPSPPPRHNCRVGSAFPWVSMQRSLFGRWWWHRSFLLLWNRRWPFLSSPSLASCLFFFFKELKLAAFIHH